MRGTFAARTSNQDSWTSCGGCCPKKPKSPSQSPWQRRWLVALVTVGIFTADLLLEKDWAVTSLWDWVSGDLGLLFYLLGFGTAYAYLRGFGFRRLVQRPVARSATEQLNKSHPPKTLARAASKQGKATPSRTNSSRESARECAPYSSEQDMMLDSSCEKQQSVANSSTARINCAISQAALKSGPEKAGEVLEHLESSGGESDATSYNLLIRAFAKHGDVKKAEFWFQRMVDRGLKPNEYSFNTLMNSYAKMDDKASVELWMEKLLDSGVNTTGISFAIAIHSNARRGDVERAHSWMQRMTDAGLEPDCVNYNSLIHACSIRKDAEGAEDWFEKLKSKGLEPTVMTYTAMVDACSKSLDVVKAEKWMEQLLGLGLEPNVVSFSAMIDACARVGDLERAERWHGKMQELCVQPNAYIYSALINACARANDVSAACAWLKKAEASGTTLDAVVYGCVINACGKAGDSASAMIAFRQMRSQGIKTHIIVYGALARPFAYEGDYEQVEKIRDEMIADGIHMNDYYLYTLLLAYSRARPRMSHRAESEFHKALAEGIQPNERVIQALYSAVGRTRCASILETYGLEPPSPRERAEGGNRFDSSTKRRGPRTPAILD